MRSAGSMLALVVGGLLITAAPGWSQSQQQPRPLPPPGGAAQQQPQQAAPQQAPPKAYQPVAISAPQPLKDPSFDSFRSQLGDIAKRKDRAALAKVIVAKDFFWFGDKGDRADKKRPGVDNLARALDLNAKDGSGWEALAGFAAESTAMALPDRKDTVCAPADPVFDVKELENLAKTTGTEESDWGYPIQPGIEVRAAPQPNAPVIEKLGMHFVRVMDDDAQPPAGQVPMLRVVAPSGKVGYVPADALSPLGNDQLCYVREPAGWRIAGFVGGQPQ
jgi:hypothetical protein